MAIKCPTFNSGQSVSKTATIGPMLLFFLLLMVYLLRKRKILAFWAVSNLLAVGFLGSVLNMWWVGLDQT